MEIIKTMPTDLLTTARGEFDNAGTAAAQAFARADQERARIIQRLLDYAVSESIAPKVAVEAIMSDVVKPCTLTKEDQRAGHTPASTGKLAYSTGAAYAKSMEIAMLKARPFAVGLYAASLKESAQAKEAAHAQKLAQAEQAAKDAQTKAKTLATKAARSKSVEAKLAAETAKLEAVKAAETVRAVIDKAPVSGKTGGRKAAPKNGPVKAVTRHEVALHATALVAMLRSVGEDDCADEVADVLRDHNLLAK